MPRERHHDSDRPLHQHGVVDVSLSPDQERVLDALAAELAATDPALALRLGAAAPADIEEPARPACPTLATQLAGLLVLLMWSALGLVPLVLGLGLALPWLAGVGAVTTCAAPLGGLWATARVFPRFVARLRGSA